MLHAETFSRTLLTITFLGVSSPLARAQPEGGPEPSRELVALLTELDAESPLLPAQRERFADRLAALGGAAVPTLYERWREEGRSERSANIAEPLLRLRHEERVHAVLELALSRLEHQGLHPLLHERAKAGASETLPALRLLGRIGRSRTIAPWCSLLRGVESDLHGPLVRQVARRSLASIVERDPGSYPRLSSALIEVSKDCREVVLESVAEVGDDRSRSFLISALGLDESLDAKLLLSTTRDVSELDESDRRALGAFVASALLSSSLELRRSATVAAQRLRDPDVIEPLIAGLDSPELPYRTQVHEALRFLTSQDLPAQTAAWSEWWREERRWWNEVGRVALAATEPTDAASVHATLELVRSHRVFAQPIAEIVTGWLESPDARIRRGACATLVALPAPASRAALRGVLEHEDPRIRAMASRVLHSADQRR